MHALTPEGTGNDLHRIIVAAIAADIGKCPGDRS